MDTPTAEQVAEVQSRLQREAAEFREQAGKNPSSWAEKILRNLASFADDAADMLAALQTERERLEERLKTPPPKEVWARIADLTRWPGRDQQHTMERRKSAALIERLARRNAELEAELRANGETALRAQAMEIDRLSGPTKRLPPPPEKEG